jgi:hypothetical protein
VEHDTEESSSWLLRTEIVLTVSGSNIRLNLKSQSPEIKAVLRRAIDLADLYIVFGSPSDRLLTEEGVVKMKTPFTTSGLQYLVHLALIDAADELGYNEDKDIVDRLETGSLEEYVKPLRGLVSVFHLLNVLSDCFRDPPSHKRNSESNSEQDCWCSANNAKEVAQN